MILSLGETWLAGFIGAKWQLKVLQDVQTYSQIITTNKPTSNFLQAGCPSCHPTNSVEAPKEK